MRRGHLDCLRQAGDEVAPADQEGTLLGHRECGAHGDLDVFGSALADQQSHGAADVLDQRLVHLVTSHARGGGGDDPAKRYDRDLGGATADVDDHGAGGRLHRQAGPDRGRHRLLDQMRLSRGGHRRRVCDGTLLDLGDS